MSASLDPRLRNRLVDVAVVLGALAFSILQLALGGGFGDFADVTAGPDGLSLALVALSALALVWRNQHPHAVLVVTLALTLALAAMSYGVHAPAAPAVALYAIAVRPRPGRSWPVLANCGRWLGGAGAHRDRCHPVRSPGLLAAGTHLGGRMADR
jgi:hypothetical protein